MVEIRVELETAPGKYCSMEAIVSAGAGAMVEEE